jgi:hypothetical protein
MAAPTQARDYITQSINQWAPNWYRNLSDTQRARVVALSQQAFTQGIDVSQFRDWLFGGNHHTVRSWYNKWREDHGQKAYVPKAIAPPEDTGGDEGLTPEQEGLQTSLLNALKFFGFEANDLASAVAFVKDSITKGWKEDQIYWELRGQDFYKKYFPEFEMRMQNGLGIISEGEILNLRKVMREQARAFMGVEVTNDQLANLIANDISPGEFGHRLQTYKKVQDMGGPVRDLFQAQLGITLTDQDLQEFFDPDIDTAHLDRAYEDALYRGRPAFLGLGIRGQEEADLLRQFGIDTEKAYAGYERIAGEVPRFQKLEAIESNLTGLPNGNQYFNETSGNLLFKGIMLGARQLSPSSSRPWPERRLGSPGPEARLWPAPGRWGS